MPAKYAPFLRFFLSLVVIVLGAFVVIKTPAYATELIKNLIGDFNEGTYSSSAYQTLFGRTGVQINVVNGPSGTQFKLPITIDNTATTSSRTNYVVIVPINTVERISEGMMQSDCGDIRFRDADDSTAITEFEIRGCNTSSSYILVEVPSIPASATKQIFMYYGAPTTLSSQSTPQTPSPGEIFEDMQSTPSGTLKGTPTATYNFTDKYVQLTNTQTNANGALEYDFNPGENFDATFDLWAGGGSGADATYLYVYADSTPTNEYEAVGGYVLQINDLSDYVAVQYNGDVLITRSLSDDESGVLDGAAVDDEQWHPIRITKTGDRIRIYYENIKLIDYVDTVDRDLTGTLAGVGARNGALTNFHRIRNLRISQTVVTSDEESLNSGTWESPDGGDAYQFSNINGWGDGIDDNSTAFSATIASASSKATVEFQMKTADSASGLTSTEYISIGTASAGVSFTKTKQDLDTAGVLAKKFVQIKSVLSRNLSRSAVLQGFTLTYDGVAASDSSSSSEPNGSNPEPPGTSAPSTPSCNDWKPVGTADLFQINRTRNSATLYFTPVNDYVKKYHVMYGFTQGDQRFGQVGAEIHAEENKGVQSITINHLDPRASYWFTIAPVNGCATGGWSNWLEAKRVGNNLSIFYRWFQR